MEKMKVIKFNPDEFEDCRTVGQIWAVLGVTPSDSPEGGLHFDDKETFGKKAYYDNTFISQEAYERAEKALKKNVLVGRAQEGSSNEEEMMSYSEKREVFAWAMMSPVSNGARYEKIVERLGELPDDALVIVMPGDEMYREAPDV